jgi:hypothetical protein
LPSLQQRQILGMELRQEITRRLRRRQFIAQQQRQRLVLPELTAADARADLDEVQQPGPAHRASWPRPPALRRRCNLCNLCNFLATPAGAGTIFEIAEFIGALKFDQPKGCTSHTGCTALTGGCATEKMPPCPLLAA